MIKIGGRKSFKDIFGDKEDKEAFEHALIIKVEEVQHIWDTENVDYSSKTKRQNAFMKISNELGKSGEKC